MQLNPAEYPALKSLIQNTPAYLAFWNAGGVGDLERELNLMASPDFWVWRTDVTRSQIYHTTSVDGTTWNWTTYKNQSQGEQGSWVQIFMGDQANFALPNLRAGIQAIFSGSGAQATQNAHIMTIGRRKCTIAEKLYAVGTGSTVTPATMVEEGHLSDSDIQRAMQS